MPMRRVVSLVVLFSLLAVTLEAGGRRRAVAPARGASADALGLGRLSGASLSGTVSAVEGSLILLDTGGAPAIPIEASSATIVANDQLIQTVADVLPGARITAFGESSGSDTLQARLILIESRPPLMLAGEVESVDLAASTFTLLGVTIAVDDETRFDTAFPTFAPMNGLADLRAGNFIKVDAQLPGEVVLARRVLVVDVEVDEARMPVSLRGVVESMSDSEWVISDDRGNRTTLLIDERTRIAGDPSAGDEVQVVAQRTSSGQYLALVIVRIAPIDDRVVAFRGWSPRAVSRAAGRA